MARAVSGDLCNNQLVLGEADVLPSFELKCPMCHRSISASQLLRDAAARQELYSRHPEYAQSLQSSPLCDDCSSAMQRMAFQQQQTQ